MRCRHLRLPVAATLLVTAAVAACSPGADNAGGGPDGTDATATSQGPETSSSSASSSSSSSPLPPVVPITQATTPGTPPNSSTPAPTGPLIASATWMDSDYGVTLRIAPTEAARTSDGPADSRTAWGEVLALAPAADTPGMWEQFDCHWVWARIVEPDKPTWNVEPWRPVVDEGRMLAEGCNPGGPEV